MTSKLMVNKILIFKIYIESLTSIYLICGAAKLTLKFIWIFHELSLTIRLNIII